ncbi:tetratricopeptide repeat protein [Mucilaginibacter terrenus]|uniref:Tetratricopeptide repeat protein n=1 Tax=Mucilaginibacter terrenus TaxID=2482727 RepID=A0A3E2NUN8_9SPHI|nr:tetratricopeptide repeat protein [Mucilaginibacter terrenus]RFZ84726.1 tetratricopeptide repeat protein [Mucilaginibacter terrenus]
MKIKFLMAGLLGVMSMTAFAQKDVKTAQSEFDKYQGLFQIQPAVAKTSLTNAKTAIDKAAADAKTSNLAQTQALKGAIYGTLADLDSTSTSAQLFSTAEEALKKAKTLDAKGEYKKVIEDGEIALSRQQFNAGVKAYQSKSYGDAYKAFDYYRNLRPDDTTALLYTGLAAYNGQNYPAAISNFSKLVTTKYSGGETIYDEVLSNAYLFNKDTVGALKAVSEGVAKYPNSAKLRKKEIEISLQSGKSKEVLDKVLAAINNDPKNASLYYYAGLVYSQTADGAAAKAKATKVAADKAAANATKTESYTKAADMYKKALAIDPNYFEANLNLGYVLLAPAIETFNAANNLPGNAASQKQYDGLMAKASGQFDVAKPYLVKAVELQPKNPDALANLITYYKGKKDDANVAKYNKLLNELK